MHHRLVSRAFGSQRGTLAKRGRRAVSAAIAESLESRQLLAFDFSFNGVNIGGSSFAVPGWNDFGDVNNDGLTDMVNTHAWSEVDRDRVRINLGNGRGQFQQVPDLVSTSPRLGGVRLGDLNGDGNADVVATGLIDDTLRVWLGNGNGTFGAEAIYANASPVASPAGEPSTTELQLVDINGDGKLDAVVGSLNYGIRVLTGNGSGGFDSAVFFALDQGGGVNDMVIVDADNDGAPDITYSSRNGPDIVTVRKLRTSSVIVNGQDMVPNVDSNVRFSAANVPGGGTVFALAEEGGDRRLIYGRNVLSPTDVTTFPINRAGAGEVVIADLNGDSIPDLAVPYRVINQFGPDSVQIQAGTASGVPFSSSTTTVSGGRTLWNLSAAQLNADGNTDLLLGSLGIGFGYSGYSVFLNNNQSLVVNTATDEDDGNARWDSGTGTSLREAFNYAKSLGGNRTITFAPFLSTTNPTINVTGPTMAVGGLPNPSTLTIRNDRGRVTISGNATRSLFTIPFLGLLQLENLNITNFRASDASGNGGAVYVGGFGTLNAYNTTFYGNSASAQGGAIYAARDSVMAIRNSTFNGNTSNVAAIAMDGFGSSGPLIENSTIVGNTGGGVYNAAGGTRLFNNIIAGNGSSDLGLGSGNFTGDRNLVQTGPLGSITNTINAAPALGGLTDNGGRTLTMLPTVISPAIDAGVIRASVPADQRGVARPQISAPDLGAVEARASDLNLRTVTTPDGASWYLLGAAGNDLRVYRQAPGQTAQWIDNGAASFLALQNDGSVIVRTSAGAVFTRTGSANGAGNAWVQRQTATNNGGGQFVLGTDGSGGNSNIYYWDTAGNFSFTNGLAARIGYPGGAVLAQTANGDVFLRNDSFFGVGDAWVQTPSAIAGDGATWFIFSSLTSGNSAAIVRWDVNGSFAGPETNARALAVQQDGSIVARDGNQIITRIGSASGLGSGWSTRSPVAAADGGLWFFGTDGPSEQFNIYRWSGTQFNFTNGWGTRLGAANGTIVHQNSGGAMYVGVGSASGPVSSWSLANATTAGDGATWFVAAPAGVPGDIFRWDVNASPEPTSGVGVTLSTTPSGFIRTTTAGQEIYHRIGSATGLGTEWRLLTESLVVTTLADENDFSSTANLGTGTSLREAIDFANANPGADTITFAPGLIASGQAVQLAFGATGADDDSAIRVVSDLTINGGGATISYIGDAGRRLFANFAGSTFTLRDLTISGGNMTGVNDGGAIWTTGNLVIDNVRFQNNAANNGGAVRIAPGGTANVTNSTFNANTARDLGGAISSDGGVSITGSTFTSNAAGEAGAIQSVGTLNIDTSTFTNNASDLNGGALRLFGNATINSSTFTSNTVVNEGGALVSFGNLTVTNSTFAGNGKNAVLLWDGTADLRHITVAYNTNGGVVRAFADTTLRNSIVAGNTNFDQAGTLNPASSNNLLNVSATEAGLGTLANNGGPTQTIALLPGSPAVNGGVAIAGITADQRGTLRPQFGVPDIGAFEQTPYDTGQTIVTTGGANWYLGPDAVGSDQRVYRELPGQLADWVGGGLAARIGQTNDGTVTVQNAAGGIFARVGSSTGAGTTWQQQASVVGGDGATWFLGVDTDGADNYIYRWAPGGVITYTFGNGSHLQVIDGIVFTRTASGDTYRRNGSDTGFGTDWQLIAPASVTASQFEFETRQAVVFDFTGEARPFFDRFGIAITNLTTGQPVSSDLGTFTWNADGTRATFDFTNQLPDANYRITLGGTIVNFDILAGDINRDGVVDAADYAIVAANYGQAGRTFTQGNADYSSDGRVNITDLAQLARNFAPGPVALLEPSRPTVGNVTASPIVSVALPGIPQGLTGGDLLVSRNGGAYTPAMSGVAIDGAVAQFDLAAVTSQRGFYRFRLPADSFSFNAGAQLAADLEFTFHNYRVGDMNSDGEVNNLDIAPFVQGLTSPQGFAATFGYSPTLVGDINNDGAFNNLDIAPFVSLLTGGRPDASVPPSPTRVPMRSPMRSPGGLGLFGEQPIGDSGRSALSILR